MGSPSASTSAARLSAPPGRAQSATTTRTVTRCFAELGRQLVQLVFRARHERPIRAACCELSRQLGTNARRSPGHQRARPEEPFHAVSPPDSRVRARCPRRRRARARQRCQASAEPFRRPRRAGQACHERELADRAVRERFGAECFERLDLCVISPAPSLPSSSGGATSCGRSPGARLARPRGIAQRAHAWPNADARRAHHPAPAFVLPARHR